jgi:hypothetical protein
LVEVTQIAPMVAGCVSSTILMFVVSLLTQKISPVPAYITGVMTEAATIGPLPKPLLAATDSALAPEAAAVDAALEKNGDDG